MIVQVTNNKSFVSPYQVESKESYDNFLRSVGLDNLIAADFKISDPVIEDDDFDEWLRS